MTGPAADERSQPGAFDLTGALPRQGTHVLEASAGTGKTYAIAALATRYLAAGVPLADILMVTFSRAATQELRDRIRERLVETEAALREVAAGRELPRDPVLRLLCQGSPSEVTGRLRRLTTALTDFDAATIGTTHEFCGRMLDELGILGEPDPRVRHVENVDETVREVASDFWLRAYAGVPQPPFGWTAALGIARAAAAFSGAFEPRHLEQCQPRLRYAEAVRAEVRRRKAALGLRGYEDLLIDLHDLLLGRVAGRDPDEDLAAATRARLRERFPIVLIDEFQDTDPLQWQIFKTAFAGSSTLVLIGDPKQAIYAFRGADVYSYLDAVAEPETHHHTLDRNWRTDAALLEPLGQLFADAHLGDARIRFREVTAQHAERRLRIPDPDLDAPLRVRTLPLPAEESPRHSPKVHKVRETIDKDLVADIGALLRSGARLRMSPGQEPERPLHPGDIAVLVRANWQAEKLREALSAAGIPAVHAGATSVYASPVARDWLTLLQACDSPRSTTIREVALTCFVGWSFTELATADDERLTELTSMIRAWGRTLSDHGVAALLEAMLGAGLAARLLAVDGGDRRLTDIRHIAQALHARRLQDRLGTAALIEWLSERRAEAASADDERTRRLETDADAVQVMTVHRSKGLEFPVVYLPDQWDSKEFEDRGHEPFAFHHHGGRVLYLGDQGRDRRSAWDAHLQQEAGHALRLLYVAATRAQCQLVLWWAGVDRYTPTSPLHRLLFRDGPEPARGYAWDSDPHGLPRLSGPGVRVQPITALALAGNDEPPADQPQLAARPWRRELDADWRRTSYSALTAPAHVLPARSAGPGGGELVEETIDDELTDTGDEPAEQQPTRTQPAFDGDLARLSPMADLPRGPAFGTLVHAIYEEFDPTATDLGAELTSHARYWLSRLPSLGVSAAELGAALLPGVQTSLGPIADGLRLCDLPRGDRLAELDFEYPLAGGDRPAGRRTLADIADLLRRTLAPNDPLRAYPDRLADPLLAEQVLRGFLVGSIDAVLRIGRDDPRYLVVDYKTNWLGSLTDDEPLRLGHYTPPALAEAMMAAHYPLQALVYSVALHRFLRWRRPGYDPDRHLGGTAYLFVRGMAGADTPVVDGTPCGVFAWRPPTETVVELSDLLTRGAEA